MSARALRAGAAAAVALVALALTACAARIDGTATMAPVPVAAAESSAAAAPQPRYREATQDELRAALLPVGALPSGLTVQSMGAVELAYPDPGLFGDLEVSPSYCYGPTYPDHRGLRAGQVATNADQSFTLLQLLVSPYAGSGLEPATAAVLPTSCPEADVTLEDGTTVHVRLRMLDSPGIGESSAIRRNDNTFTAPDGSVYTSTILTGFATKGPHGLMVAVIVYDGEPDVPRFHQYLREAFDHAMARLH